MISAIHQPEFFPWVNFFFKIKQVNTLIFLDNVQYNRRSFQNRNLINTSQGKKYLSIPVKKAKRETNINQIEIDNSKDWINLHLQTLKQNYKHANYFPQVFEFIKKIYLKKNWIFLYEFNIYAIISIAKKLKLNLNFLQSSKYQSNKKKSELILDLCLKTGTNHYLTGLGSLNYLKEEEFKKEKIMVEFIKPKKFIYDQKIYNSNFTENLSILDYLFNCGYDQFSKL